MTLEVVREELEAAAGDLDAHGDGFEGNTLAVSGATGESYGHVELADWVVETGVTVDEAVAEMVGTARTIASDLRTTAASFADGDEQVGGLFGTWPGLTGGASAPLGSPFVGPVAP